MKKIIPLIALSAISMPAMATDQNTFYGSLGGGAYRLKSDGFNETAPTMSILGGYNFTERFALEAAYTKLYDATGTIEGIDVNVDGNVWDLSTKWSIPMGKRFSPYGRIGWSYLDTRLSGTVDGITERVNVYDDAFSWAVGTGIKLNKRLALNGEYSRVLVNNADFDRMSLNLNYRFGSH
ncbi:MAG: porin family protein [Woeseiaceae bacterium]|nr:porin family protein [Woeseiaceae bacterium]